MSATLPSWVRICSRRLAASRAATSALSSKVRMRVSRWSILVSRWLIDSSFRSRVSSRLAALAWLAFISERPSAISRSIWARRSAIFFSASSSSSLDFASPSARAVWTISWASWRARRRDRWKSVDITKRPTATPKRCAPMMTAAAMAISLAVHSEGWVAAAREALGRKVRTDESRIGGCRRGKRAPPPQEAAA
jgi:hypothetical protein